MNADHPTVLFADNSYTFGGAINALEHLLSAIDGIRPVVLSAQPEAALRRHFPGILAKHWPVRLSWVHDSVHQRVLQWPGFRRRPMRQIWSKLRVLAWIGFVDFPETCRLVRFFKQHDVRLVHLNNGVDGMLPVLLAAKLLRLPVVAHARGPVSVNGVARAYAQIVDHWIAVSGFMARNVAEAGVDEKRITVVHDAIDLSRFEAAAPPPALRAEIGIPVKAPVFGIFARIVDWKGIREFVQAARLVIEAVPDAYALVVGDASDGSEEYYQDVMNLAAEVGIGDRVIFTGFRKDVADLMRLCDVAVHSSIVPEPFGMTVIEAMATGTPVVAANAGGPTEIINSEELGLLVDPNEAPQLARAIVRLLSDPTFAERVGTNGARHISEHYSAQRYARDVELIYKRFWCDAAVLDPASDRRSARAALIRSI